VNQQRWAAAHFRVERESAGVLMRKAQRRKATKQAIEHGEPIPLDPSDVVRIYDRDGEVVFEQDWGTNRSSAMAHEAQIVDDLLHLDVFMFCGKYGIITPALPPIVDAEPATDPEGGTVPGSDPEAEAPARPEQGSG
jgi:hypothetical protein